MKSEKSKVKSNKRKKAVSRKLSKVSAKSRKKTGSTKRKPSLLRKIDKTGKESATGLKSSSVRQTRSSKEILLFSDENIEVKKEIVDDFLASAAVVESSQQEKAKIDENYIRINKTTNLSPYLVDLKKQEIVTKYSQAKVSQPTLEDRLAIWESKLTHRKANFITADAVRQAKLIRHRQPGRLRRFFIIAVSRFSSVVAGRRSKIEKWGDVKTTTYLQKMADRQHRQSEAEETIDLEQPLVTDYRAMAANKPGSLVRFLPAEARVSIVIFLLIALFVTLPIKALHLYHDIRAQGEQVLGASANVYQDFTEGLSAFGNFDFNQAGVSFSDASEEVLNIKDVINEYPSFLLSLAKIIPQVGEKIKVGTALVDIANSLSQIGTILSQVLAQTVSGNSPPTVKLTNLGLAFKQVNYLLTVVESRLNSINLDDVPDEYEDKIKLLKQWLPIGFDIIGQVQEVSEFSAEFLGDEAPQRYLLVFQNSNELRPTGGFMGTVAEVDLKQGEVTRLHIPPGGIYDLQGNLEVLLAAPRPLHMLNANWQMQDANWWFDFPTSANKILWFYEKSGGPTVDGLVAVNSTVLPDLLNITGPIYLSDFGLTLTADNVITELHKEVELEYNKDLNQPKKIISDLTPILLEKLQTLQGKEFLSLFNVFNQALYNREIQFYHSDETMQQKLVKLGWAGEAKTAKQDYLAIINTNIGGGKTDGVIAQKFYLTTEMNRQGEIVNHLTIKKEHLGNTLDFFSGQDNLDYLRVYVPPGSRLLQAKGFYQPLADEFSDPAAGYSTDKYLQAVEQNPQLDEYTGTRITQEFGKTVFANWVKLSPGEIAEVSITYALPFKLEFQNSARENILIEYFDKTLEWLGSSMKQKEFSTYSIWWQKQSGQKAAELIHRLEIPASWQATVSPSLLKSIYEQAGDVYYQSRLEHDNYWGVILSR